MGSGQWHLEERESFRSESFAKEYLNVPENGSLSIIVLGASGDLAKKKTFPALFHLFRKGFLQPDEVNIFGYARTKISDDELRNRIRGYLISEKGALPDDLEKVKAFLHLIKYVSGAYDTEEGFRGLDQEIFKHEVLKNSVEGSSRRLFYLALPPSVYPSVCKMIRNYCMNRTDLGGWTRIVVEKPFGKDLESAEQLSTQIGELFDETQIYRIDHYLGKELVQNMLVLRFSNRFFLPLWNRDNIDNIQIVFREDFGTAGRGGYFDEYGIIRDIIQNHLLQVLCLVAMEKPISLNPDRRNRETRDRKNLSISTDNQGSLGGCLRNIFQQLLILDILVRTPIGWQELYLSSEDEWECPNDCLCYQNKVEADKVFKFGTKINSELDDVRGQVLDRRILPNMREVFTEDRRYENKRKVIKDAGGAVGELKAGGAVGQLEAPVALREDSKLVAELVVLSLVGPST